MTPLGWIFMVLSWATIIGLTFFCFLRIFSKKKID